MKKIISTFAALSVAASSLLAADINAVKIDTDLSRISYTSVLWEKAKFSDVVLYPQTTLKLNDKKANELNANNNAKKAQIAAIYNDSDIAFMIKWPDGTMNIQSGNKTNSYADGFAVQFASDFSDPQALPYIGMGSKDRQVVVHLQKAARGIYEPNGNGNVYYQINREQTALFDSELSSYEAKVAKIGSNDYERTFISEGFRSMTEIKDASNSSYARLGYKNSTWQGTLSRQLSDSYVNLNQGAFPVAFAVWDGEKLGRDGLKNLSSWISVKLEGQKGGDSLVAALSSSSEGNITMGRTSAVANGCTGCHQLENSDTPTYMGPALMNIGGYATEGYLRESLLNPSKVVVAGYNRNAHSNYAWYNIEEGKRVSAMPEHSWLEPKVIDDIVAYLQSLKAEVKNRR
jgi:complex iron-sulfur molybdoenzyme family reductase subunit gamma